ncbi:glycoside hydrolase family 16 protein [Botryobasidium botryosum FD-172 SS1]|uniref:Glycoside hydrolase family 16 protein n=1 Tax=Botryobasidium botryosum (strain FD-172 SS1) TaxID=930990 RepID=A0A067N0H0_BOTB1|nr:glycoside hydrolase family 16 protein [Botryobasidium botryosum FD-172 SS1]
MRSPLALAALFAFAAARASAWTIADTFIGGDFLNAFDWETLDDPTHGRVNYVDQQTALDRNLTYIAGNQFIMRADSFNQVQSDGRGRDSVRIHSHSSYQNVVLVLDIEHMPVGCGTWPAFWTLSTDGTWPTGGEIDIIEGVNNIEQDLVSLHAAEGCQVTAVQPSGSFPCDPNIDGPDGGCGATLAGSANYGTNFNSEGGGWYAMQKAGDGISVWFWPRNGRVPNDVRNGQSSVNTDAWGTPAVKFTSNSDDMSQCFDTHEILFDLTFCGDYAGGVYEQSGCPSTCEDYVDNNPSAFQDAFWVINSLRAYT